MLVCLQGEFPRERYSKDLYMWAQKTIAGVLLVEAPTCRSVTSVVEIVLQRAHLGDALLGMPSCLSRTA